MGMTGLIGSPYAWLAAFFCGAAFCVWRIDRAAARLGIKRSIERPPAPGAIVVMRGVLVTVALMLGSLYLLNGTSFPIALVFLLAGSLYFWRLAYTGRVVPLVAAGMPRPEARLFAFMQWLWLGPLTVALALFVRAKYSTH